MVMTRHRGDPDDRAYEEFVSLQSRSTRRRQSGNPQSNGFDGTDTDEQNESGSPPTDYGDSYGTRSKAGAARDVNKRTMRTRKHVQVEEEEGSSESEDSQEEYRQSKFLRNKPAPPVGRRTRRSRELMHLHEEPSDDEEVLHQEPMGRRRHFRRPSVPQEPDHQSPRRRGRTRRIEVIDDTEEDDDEGAMPVKFSPRRSSQRIVTPTKLIDRDSGSIRRSTRQKKLLYGTFNQSLIEKHVMLMGEEEDEDVHAGGEGAVQHRKRKRSTEVEPTPEQDGLDMYSRVKRVRRQVKRDMYGIPVNEDEQQEDTGSSSDTSAEDEDDEDDDDDEEVATKQGRQYYLRQHKPRTNLYEAAPIQPQKRQTRGMFRNITPPRTFRATTYRSPAHKSPRFRNRSTSASTKRQEKKSTPKPASREKKSTPKPASREKKSTPKPASRQKKTVEAQEKPKPPRRRPQLHGNSSTSSSSDSDSEDEQRFQRRKAKSMARNRNRCLPMNFTAEDVGTGMLKDRTKIGTSLADVDPMSVDKSVSFDSVGGLGKHIRSLKEMIVFPLLYPEVFERFKISPPRGVLFYGPPGTGKTLVARALANECGSEERKVAFFMRKGADCLSKWVGESERQLRLLFDQAYQMRPSIIFFDEIDGLAPVRSSRQDQIHSSIVSTLLALMDGLDNRGEIVIIGATNRLDSIDPALRRPGRFDREFLFPLPSVEARKQILEIHTKEWNPKLCEGFLTELAGNCVGYCGADLKALCTEGALHALRRRYPQIYTSEDKLELDVSAIEVSARDFHKAMQNIVPASQRSVTSPGRALDRIIKPLLTNVFQRVLVKVESMFPMVVTNSNSLNAPVNAEKSTSNDGHDELCSDEDDDNSQPIYEATARNGRKKRNGNGEVTPFTGTYLNFMQSATQRPFTYRPRLLLAGEYGQGQSTHLGPALLHQLERVPVHIIDLPALYAVSAHTPEEACAQIFREARRTSPSILYMPHIGEFWEVINPTLQATFLALLYDLEPTMPIFMVATCEMKHYELPQQVKCLFGSEEIVTMENPSEDERREFFEDLLLNQLKKPPSTRKQAATRVLEVLPKAKPVEPRKLTETELKQLQKQEEKHLRELRLFLRDILNKLGRDRKFGIFAKPVDTEDVPDYYEIITNPMDLSAMMTKIDLHKYQGVKEFLDDINLICSNALEYNPDKDPAGRAIRHRACALRDTCQALIEAELDPEFEKLCDEVRAARERRGEESSATVPSFYYTKPAQSRLGTMSSSVKYPSRYGCTSGGIETEEQDISTWQEGDADTGLTDTIPDNGPKIRAIVKRVVIHRKAPSKNQSPWCRPSKKRYRKIIVYVDEFGNEVPPPGAAGDKAGGDGEEGDKDIEEQSPSAQDKGSKDDTKYDTDATVEADHEAASEEKENKPESQATNSPKAKSQQSSPNVIPPAPSLRSASRQGRSPVSTGAVLTRSTSPRSVSPRGRRSDRPTETPRRTSQGSPKGELKMDEVKTVSPKMQRRRSSRSGAHGTADAEQMDTSPARSSEQPSQTTPQTSPKSNTASPPAAAPASSSPPSTSSPPQPKSIPSKLTPYPPNTSESPTTEKATTEETSADTNEEKTETAMSPKVRMTRSKSQVPAAVEAMAKRLLETDTPTRVLVDDDELRFLLAKTVSHTKNATVEHLEKLYCRLSQAIYAHRSNIDKTDLLQDLGQIVSSFTTNHRSST